VKLLRVLETGSLVRVGAAHPTQVDVRVVAATNRNPEEAVKANRLREDLYYRLNVFPIHLPPLRERPGDVEVLAQHFLQQLNCEGSTAKRWSRAALERLRCCSWPGNVRELWNVIQRAYILGKDEIDPEVLPLPPEAPIERSGSPVLEIRVGSTIADAEQRLILATLELMGGDKKKSARALGISVKTLYSRLNVYDAAQRARKDPEASTLPPTSR
jgi:DNA-binding NtrC family response regulator